MKLAIAFEDLAEARYQRIKNVTLWALITVVLVFSIVFINSCIPQPANAEEIDMNIIATIESNNNPNAYNYKSKARGLCQITEICLKEFAIQGCSGDTCKNGEWARYQAEGKIQLLYNPEYNLMIANWYMNKRIPQMLRYYALQDTINARLACYNAGIGVYLKYKQGKRKLPDETKQYINKYYKLKGGKK